MDSLFGIFNLKNLFNTRNKIIFTNGCFDIFHAGHLNLLLYCKSLAGNDGKVYVAIDSDEKIKKDKGLDRPIFCLQKRKENLWNAASINGKLVDAVFSFNTNEELYSLILSIQPFIIVKGEDYIGKKVIGENISIVKYCPFYCDISTSKILKEIKKKEQK